jgi:hypothetical protein
VFLVTNGQTSQRFRLTCGKGVSTHLQHRHRVGMMKAIEDVTSCRLDWHVARRAKSPSMPLRPNRSQRTCAQLGGTVLPQRFRRRTLRGPGLSGAHCNGGHPLTSRPSPPLRRAQEAWMLLSKYYCGTGPFAMGGKPHMVAASRLLVGSTSPSATIQWP